MSACEAGKFDLDLLPENGCECATSLSGVERCNGDDEDCDGAIDEDIAGNSCDQNGDGCAMGILTCSEGAGECMGDECPAGEFCNGESCVENP